MKKTYCILEAPFDINDGDTVLLLEGSEILKEHGVKRMYRTAEGYVRYDNWDEWTIQKKDLYYVLHLNPYSKPRKRSVIKGNNFLFVG